MSASTLREAAIERSHAVRQRVDKPSKRRSAERQAASNGARAAATCLLRVADGGAESALTFEGHATVYEAPYEMYDWYGPYTEIVTAGAATRTLSQTVPALDVTLNLGHDQLRRIASTVAPERPLQLTEDETGLHVLAEQLDPEDQDVRYIAPKLRSGLITEMSFAFRITRGQWSPDYSEYRIDEFDLHRGDVAIVGYGANPHTDGALRSSRRSEAAQRSRRARQIELLKLR